jgi:hypothetical protein
MQVCWERSSRKMEAETAVNLERRQKAERFVLLDPPRIPEKPLRCFLWE